MSNTPGRRWVVRAGVCLSVASTAAAIAISVHSAYATPKRVAPRPVTAPIAAAAKPSPALGVLPKSTKKPKPEPDYAVTATTARAVVVGDTATISVTVTNRGTGDAIQPGYFIGAGEGATVVAAPHGCKQLPDLDTGDSPAPAPDELTFTDAYNCPMAKLRAGESVTITMRVQLTVADPTYLFVGAGDYDDGVRELDYDNNTTVIHINPDFG